MPPAKRTKKLRDKLVIRKKRSDMSSAFKLLTKLPDDFMKGGRHDPLPQKRKF